MVNGQWSIGELVNSELVNGEVGEWSIGQRSMVNDKIRLGLFQILLTKRSYGTKELDVELSFYPPVVPLGRLVGRKMFEV